MKLPVVKPKDLLRALSKEGFEIKRSKKHAFLKHPDGRFTSISIHPKPIPKGTLRAILRQADLTPEKLKELL